MSRAEKEVFRGKIVIAFELEGLGDVLEILGVAGLSPCLTYRDRLLQYLLDIGIDTDAMACRF